MPEPLRLTGMERRAYLGHAARERELRRAVADLGAEFRDLVGEIADRLGVAPEAIGRDLVLDTATWELKPAEGAPAALGDATHD